jgi:flagellar motor switch protein FliM
MDARQDATFATAGQRRHALPRVSLVADPSAFLARTPRLDAALRTLPALIREQLHAVGIGVTEVRLERISTGMARDVWPRTSDASLPFVIAVRAPSMRLFTVLPHALAGVLIDALVGGVPAATPPIQRAMTAIDTAFLGLAATQVEHAAARILGGLLGDCGCEGQGVAADEFNQIIASQMAIILVEVAAVVAGSDAASVRIVLPIEPFQAHRHALASEAMAVLTPEPDPAWRYALDRGVDATPVTITVALDDQLRDLAEIGRLRVGQVLALDLTPADLVFARVDQNVMFAGRLGRQGDVLSVRLDGPCAEDLDARRS